MTRLIKVELDDGTEKTEERCWLCNSPNFIRDNKTPDLEGAAVCGSCGYVETEEEEARHKDPEAVFTEDQFDPKNPRRLIARADPYAAFWNSNRPPPDILVALGVEDNRTVELVLSQGKRKHKALKKLAAPAPGPGGPP